MYADVAVTTNLSVSDVKHYRNHYSILFSMVEIVFYYIAKYFLQFQFKNC
jgi:hypothetical protein